MKDLFHSTPDVCPQTTPNGEVVSIFVDYHHPLLELGRALPWEQITDIMIREWRLSGKTSMVDRDAPWMSPYMCPWWC